MLQELIKQELIKTYDDKSSQRYLCSHLHKKIEARIHQTLFGNILGEDDTGVILKGGIYVFGYEFDYYSCSSNNVIFPELKRLIMQER